MDESAFSFLGQHLTMSQVKHKPHCVYRINDHFVWVPRYRHQGLVDPVAGGLFVRSGCGFAAPADLNAAMTIPARAAVKDPGVSTQVTKDVLVNSVTVPS